MTVNGRFKAVCTAIALLPILCASCCPYAGQTTCPKSYCSIPCGQKVSLVGETMLGWNQMFWPPWEVATGHWRIAGDASLDPADEQLLVAESGTGVMVNARGKAANLAGKREFGDIAAHIEFMVPKGSNSGVYFAGRYEVQIFDSYGVGKPKYSDCGGIYQRWDTPANKAIDEGHAPLLNASKKPGEWQTFDIIFRAPRFDEEGNKIANAKFEKVVHNNVVIQKDVEVTGPTRSAEFDDETPTGPIVIQGNHGPVAYSNIWVMPLDR
jgi:hypothetical protein